MKKILFLGVILLLFSCEDERVTNNCFQGIKLNEIVYLNNPEFINLGVPSGSVITTLQGRTVLILRQRDNYKVFDLQCPEKDCGNPMSFNGLNALEYNTQINGNRLIISR